MEQAWRAARTAGRSPGRAGSEATRLRFPAAVEDVAGLPIATVEALERVLDHLQLRPLDELAEVMRLLQGILAADGVALVSWQRGGSFGIRAASGSLAELPEAVARRLAPFPVEPGPPRYRSGFRSGAPWCSYAQRLGDPEQVPGLVAWGADPALCERDGVLRLALRLIDHQTGRASVLRGAGRPSGMPSLVLPDGFVKGPSAAMAAVYDELALVAQDHLPVVLLGETGVGKEHLARSLHDSSPRLRRPFVALNCAAIPEALLEAELFGIARGVATGVDPRRGKFVEADGGTLFLDEVGEMPLPLQAKLLRALAEREVVPLGGTPVKVAARVIAATNLDLEATVRQGRFRLDLYHRLSAHVLRVPALRERREDVPALVELFVHEAAADLGKTMRGVSPQALQVLANGAWPGNVRELRHEVRRMVLRCPDGGVADVAHLSPHLLAAPDLPDELAPPATLELHEHERQLIRLALARAGGNRSQAARLLGLSRSGLNKKLRRDGL